jgi:hypothetical protein
MPKLPPNIEEFNTIAGLIFAQLYQAFPILVDLIDRQAVAKAMGVGADLATHKLPSGRSFADVFVHTISWLNAEDYIKAAGGHPAERVTLSTKGLAAMNAVPPGLEHSLGSELTKAAGDHSAPGVATRVAEIMGAFAGSFTKSFTGER